MPDAACEYEQPLTLAGDAFPGSQQNDVRRDHHSEEPDGRSAEPPPALQMQGEQCRGERRDARDSGADVVEAAGRGLEP